MKKILIVTGILGVLMTITFFGVETKGCEAKEENRVVVSVCKPYYIDGVRYITNPYDDSDVKLLMEKYDFYRVNVDNNNPVIVQVERWESKAGAAIQCEWYTDGLTGVHITSLENPLIGMNQ